MSQELNKYNISIYPKEIRKNSKSETIIQNKMVKVSRNKFTTATYLIFFTRKIGYLECYPKVWLLMCWVCWTDNSWREIKSKVSLTFFCSPPYSFSSPKMTHKKHRVPLCEWVMETRIALLWSKQQNLEWCLSWILGQNILLNQRWKREGSILTPNL